jgi:hypothetical protein
VNEPSLPSNPTWIRKRDGRLVPFEADKIAQTLFAAAEEIGQADVFLARELADSVVHFLREETDQPRIPPTTEHLAELIVKVVRELGHPALAEAYAAFNRQARRRRAEQPTLPPESGSPVPPATPSARGLVHEALRDYSLRTIYARDLAAAQREGLLTITGLETPDQLHAVLVGALRNPERALLEPLAQAARIAGQVVVMEGCEEVLAERGVGKRGGALRERDLNAVEEFVRELLLGVRLIERRAVVSLNTEAGAEAESTEGALFASLPAAAPEQRAALSDALADRLAESTRGPVLLDWHLSENDFTSEARPRLLRRARQALAGAQLTFALDRPHRPAPLAEGLERRHPAVLLATGLHLPRVAEQVLPANPFEHGGEEPASAPQQEQFLDRVGRLTRLALSAAVRKTTYLRRHPDVDPKVRGGFLLERARLLVTPLGLDRAVRHLLNRGLCSDAGVALARCILERIDEALRQEGPGLAVAACIAGPLDRHGFSLDSESHLTRGWHTERVAGLTPWDEQATVKTQLQTAGELHARAGHGIAAVLLPRDQSASAEQLADWLSWAWRKTEVRRVRFVAPVHGQRQLLMEG